MVNQSPVRRDGALSRTQMIIGLSVIAVVASVAGIWVLSQQSSDALVPSPSPSPVSTPSPTPTPSLDPNADFLAPSTGPYASHFVDAEYGGDMWSSGERWLATPVIIAEPSWESEYGYYEWRLIGARSGNAILASTSGFSMCFIEVDGDGSPTHMIRASVVTTSDSECSNDPLVGAAIDTITTYDSLTSVQSFDTPVGAARVWFGEFTTWDLPDDATTTVLSEHDGSTLYEVRGNNSLMEPFLSELGLPTNPNYGITDVSYALKRPYGAWLPLETHIVGEHPVFTNGFDTFCLGAQWSGSQTLVTGVTGQHWQLSAWPGAPYLVPTETNPVAIDWHHMLVHNREDSAPTFQEYLEIPAMVAVPGPEANSWFIALHQDVSVRAWC